MSSVKLQERTQAEVLKPGNKYSCDNLGDIVTDYFEDIDILSLDCFDTILWRNVNSPKDVFYDLQNLPLFKQHGITAQLRVSLEGTARVRKFVSQGTTEVTLAEIYRAISRTISNDTVERLAAAEFEMEKKYCFGYRPIIDLMYAAISRGKKIIIASDTYFSEEQIHELLKLNLPDNVMKAISKIFVSNKYQLNKVSGLHKSVLSELRVKGHKVLHVGDNEKADYIAPPKYGVKSVQILQFSDINDNQSRMRAMGLMLMKNEVRTSEPLYDPYRALLSRQSFEHEKPQHSLGYNTLGPIYHSFAHYLKNEISQLSAQHKNVKVLFLLRDGHLPRKIFNIVCPDIRSHAVRISRFVANAASFSSREDVVNYLSETVFSGRYRDIGRQLLLSDSRIDKIIAKVESARDKRAEFINQILNEKTLSYIIEQSKLYLKRLYLYLQRSAKVEIGDTLLFVDLGYSGTAQTRLSPVFKSTYDITIYGRYLISLTTPEWRNSRAGLLDPDNCDDKLMSSIVTYVALLEQLSTTTDRSVVDFADDGEPIYGDASLNEDQYDKLTHIQDECEMFSRDVLANHIQDEFYSRPEVMRQVVIAELTRLLYFPSQAELNYLNTFKFDLNLGTDDILEMFDAGKGIDSLRRRGMFFMERNSKTMRTNYPAELRVQSLPLLTTLLSQHRHGFEYNLEDISFLSESVPVFVVNGATNARHIVNTHPTHDGFHSLIIPLGMGQYVVAAAFGQCYSWVDIYAFEAIPLRYLNSHYESIFSKDVKDQIVFDGLQHQGGGLYQCATGESIALFKPEPVQEQMVLRIVFRPIVRAAM